jgi:uncharacterized membrane protein
MRLPLLIALSAATTLLGACQQHDGDAQDATARKHEGRNHFTAIAPEETLRFSGTEPFWGGSVTGSTLTWTTPEKPEGTTIKVDRFSGNNGLGFSGKLDAAEFNMAVTHAPCSDGMTDRVYPFTVTVEISEAPQSGCGWTEKMPFKGPERP